MVISNSDLGSQEKVVSQTFDKEFENSDAPIFIFGSARSGTSLLSRIIGAHPRIAVPFESHLYNTFYPWLKYYGDLNIENNRKRLLDDILSTEVMRDWMPRPDRDQVLEAVEKHDFHGIVDALIRVWANTQGKKRWGEKTPWHVFYWREILNAFPNAKFIHIVRDGRDASLSWKRARFGPKHIYPLAVRWVEYLETVDELKKVVNSENFFELRYEDLVENPEQVIRNMCHFLGEDFSPEMLAFHNNRAPYPTDQQNQKNLTKPILADNAEKWRTEMSSRELEIFEAVAGSMLLRYRYARTVKNPYISSLEVMQFKYFGHLPRKMVAMIKNRKGHIDGLRRLRIYLRLRLGL